MNLDLHVWRFDWAGPPSTIGTGVGSLAQRAEAIGVRTLSFMDHYFQMEMAAPAEHPMLEGYTALGYVAGRTERLRLRLLVTGVTYRYPGLLAKTVTTLDVLSGGRAELGIGAAWYEREHRGLGVPFPPVAERFERLEETLQICLQMWSDDDGPFEGRHYRLAETLCHPQPVSDPRPRILIGGSGEKKTLRLVAQYADACNIFGDAAAVAQKIDVLRRHCDALGRDPNEIEVTAMYRDLPPDATVPQILEGAQRFADIGVSSLVTAPVGDDPGRWLETTFGPAMEDLAAMQPARL
ncbi:MAG: LLM class F420-dependent oxidoreductase [Actinobacteria bacterium]|nr:LLM class F420-dependent oxidoreductase [Actinomycetota bacterium]